MNIKQYIGLRLWLYKNNISLRLPKGFALLKEKRDIPVIVSMTTFPQRINSSYDTLLTLLNQTDKPDKIIMWLANEQFPNKEYDIPKRILKLKKYGLEIMFCDDIRAYKKLIPTLERFPNSIIITVDDDWYYSKDLIRILLEENNKYPDEVICHAITRPTFDDKYNLISTNNSLDYKGTSSYFNKLLGGSGCLFPPYSLDEEVINRDKFMSLASTNDDIWFWGMAVKKGTKIRLAKNAVGLLAMTNPELQNKFSLSSINSVDEHYYLDICNQLLKEYPIIQQRLIEEYEDK